MQCAKNMTLLLIVAWMASLLDSSSSYAIQSPSHHIMHSYPIFGGKNAASGLKARLDRTELKSTSRLPPLLVKKTIWGQNVAKLRSFSINGPKDFKFLGSFASNVPEYALPEVVFLGRSNVGKSSFLNSLTGRSKNVAVVSKTPGRTQRINLFEFSSSKDPICIFADLPGYGFAKVAKERQQEIEIFLRQYLEKRGSIRLAMLMVDSRRIPMLQSDIDMASYLLGLGLRLVVVTTKIDLVAAKDRAAVTSSICRSLEMTPEQIVPYSSQTGEGRQWAWAAVQNGLLSTDEYDPDPNAEILDVGELFE